MTHHAKAVDKATTELAKARAGRDEARRKLATAVGERDKIRKRVADGDSKVTGADLADADQAVELANLRTEAADKKADRAEKALHQAEVDKLRVDVQAALEGDGAERLSGQIENVAEAVVGLIDEWRRQQEGIDDLVRRSVGLTPLPDDFKRDGNRLTLNSRPVSIPGPGPLLAAVIGHVLYGQGITVDAKLGSGLGQYTGGYTGSIAHKYPLGSVLNGYATDRVFELAGKKRWTE